MYADVSALNPVKQFTPPPTQSQPTEETQIYTVAGSWVYNDIHYSHMLRYIGFLESLKYGCESTLQLAHDLINSN